MAQLGLGLDEQEINLLGLCLWVPAAVNHRPAVASNGARFVYGGVNVQPQIHFTNEVITSPNQVTLSAQQLSPAAPGDASSGVGCGTARSSGGSSGRTRIAQTALGSSTRRYYVKSPKHSFKVKGNINPAPINGQNALDTSVLIKDTSPRRIGVDYQTGDFVVFDRTAGNEYHGHTRTWDQLTDKMKNALVDAGMANRRGKLRM